MKLRLLLATLLLAAAFQAKAEVRLPGFFGDNMVLQRQEPVKIWGWADRNENVAVGFNGQQFKTRAGRDGTWEVTLPPMEHGGPHTLAVSGKSNRIEFDNIVVGEVWLCSGQSNMEWRVKSSNNAEQEIAEADYPMIRSLTVPKKISVTPETDFSARWEICSPATAGDFTAVGYFYARYLHERLGVPVGIINCSWGGTDVEVWTSPGSYEALPKEVKRSYPADAYELIKNHDNSQGNRLNYQQAMKNDPGLSERWFDNPAALSSWETMDAPKEWGSTPLAHADGHVWFRYQFDVPAGFASDAIKLHLGTIDDNDITWINGTLIGETNGAGERRVYEVPAGTLKVGKNIITVRITDLQGGGGFTGKPQDMAVISNGRTVSLAGQWKYRPSVLNSDFGIVEISPNYLNSTLWNGMANPLTNFRIKGAIWYQGENNANKAYNYRTLFPSMITDWRNKWGYDFPFYWVQLTSYMAKDNTPRQSTWAELREAQTMALSLPNTGQAVITDIGEAFDIHPRNKQDVGYRLALIALNKTYGQGDIYSGPTLLKAEKSGNRYIVTFDNIGSGLGTTNKYGYIEGFTVAGPDREFHWAKAWIQGDKVIVSSEAVDNPIAVRYNWANNPDGNLFNSDGLPAAPFRTDDWKGITQ